MKLLTNSHFYHNLQSIDDVIFLNNILEISYYNSNRKLIAEYLYYFFVSLTRLVFSVVHLEKRYGMNNILNCPYKKCYPTSM